MQCQFSGVGSMGDNRKKATASDTMPKPGKVNSVCKEWLVHEDSALAYHLQKLEVDEHYSGNRSRNAIVRQDLPTAKEEQEREIREAESRYCAFIKEQEEKDLEVALELAERLAKKKYTHEIGSKGNSAVGRPGILKKQYQPESAKSVVEFNEYTELDIDDILHEIDCEEDVSRRNQEQMDAELAKRLQEQEGHPLSVEDRDRLIAIETQDCELAKLLQEKEKARLRRAREKSRQKALLKKQQQSEGCLQSEVIAPPTQKPHSNIAIAIDPTYSSRRTELQDVPYTSTSLSSSLDDVPPYMPIQGQRRNNNQTDKKKKSKTTDGVASFFKVFK